MLQLLSKNVCFYSSSERWCHFFPSNEFTLEALDFCGFGVCFCLNSKTTFSSLNTWGICIFYEYFPTPVLQMCCPSSSCSPPFNNSINHLPLRSCHFGIESWSVLVRRDCNFSQDPQGKPLRILVRNQGEGSLKPLLCRKDVWFQNTSKLQKWTWPR